MKKRAWVAIFVILVILIMKIILSLANPRLMSEIIFTDEFSNQYLLRLSLPEQIWFGQSEKITIQLLNDKSQIRSTDEKQNSSVFDSSKIQNFEVDFILLGTELTPPGISITPIIEGKDIILNWKIVPKRNQDILGTVWIYINSFVNDDQESQRELIFTKNLLIRTKNFFGLKIDTIHWILFSLTLLNIIYLFSSFRKMRSIKVSENKKLL